VGVASAAWHGLRAFHNDAKDAERVSPADPTTKAVMGATLGTLAGGAGLAASLRHVPKGGIDVAIPYIGKSLHVPRLAAIGVLTAGAGALGAMAGAGVAPTLP